MINKERLKNLLLDLVQIDSHSREEREVAERVINELKSVDSSIDITVDDAGQKVGGNTGNVIARIKGTNPNAKPILLSAHMDTVVPGKGVKPIIDGNIIRTDGTTVLGGDDKSGVAIILETIRALKENKLEHSDIEAVFTICEEVGLQGAKHVDVTKLRSKFGLVLDSDDVGYLFTKAPSSDNLEFRVYGLEAHAGVCPERGLSAIKIAGEAISNMKLGRIDEETTANLGVIEGGMATNIVPNFVRIKGEARSHSDAKLDAQVAHMKKCFEDAVANYSVTIDGKEIRPRFEVDVVRSYHSMNVSDESHIVRLVKQAANNLQQEVKTLATGGGCDANVFNRKGIEVANLGTGMQDIHTVKEWLNVEDLYLSGQMVFEIVRLNAHG
ncbi:MAG TPA: M20/M25/M40 family metallo-hydrolase [Blastocatellia bacterium]|nr:M20/M25/M40 family metallo-hydrolase [Blastocatellia bacterium]